MWRKALWPLATWTFLLIFFSPGMASTEDERAELWESESFVRKARAIKASDWEDVNPQDLAIVGLYEMGRVVNRFEGRLESEVDRLYSFAWAGVLVLAAYLALQLVLTLVLIVRVGRRSVF